MKTARQTLQESGAEQKRLTTEIAKAEAALSEADRQASEAEATLKGFAGLDGIISRWRASELKRGGDPRRLPQELRDKQAARTAAGEELELAKDTASLLAEELSESQAKLARIKSARMPMAAAVLHEEIVAPLAREMADLQKRLWELGQVLGGYSGMAYFDPEKGYMRLGDSRLIDGAFARYSLEYIGSADPKAVMTARWKAELEKVLNDEGASIETPGPVLPSYFYGK